MSFNHSASNCIKSLFIIYSKPVKVTSKQGLSAILISLFFRIKLFQSYSFGWKNNLLNFFWIFLFNKWKILKLLGPRKIPFPRKFLVTPLILLSAFRLWKGSRITSKQLWTQRYWADLYRWDREDIKPDDSTGLDLF